MLSAGKCLTKCQSHMEPNVSRVTCDKHLKCCILRTMEQVTKTGRVVNSVTWNQWQTGDGVRISVTWNLWHAYENTEPESSRETLLSAGSTWLLCQCAQWKIHDRSQASEQCKPRKIRNHGVDVLARLTRKSVVWHCLGAVLVWKHWKINAKWKVWMFYNGFYF